MPHALVVFHERDHGLGVRNIGSIAPALRERGYEVEAVTFESDGSTPSLDGVDVVVLMGSPDAAYDDTLPWLAAEIEFVEQAVAHEIPTLGVCFGGQLLARALGGSVRRADQEEIGFVTVESDDPALIAPGPWMQFHYDTFTIPPGATSIARTAAAEQAFVHGRHLGIQFHPEIDADVFESWAQGWERRGEREQVEAEVDVPALTADVAAREAQSRIACGQLVDAFLKL
ncbi:glutamine amidotransferase [Rhodococcoides trifolii]|uniref:Glutamine amidotransferase n=1 Tax=Rhodococcoides trifolii TaxID=908250 RepID=A0A917CS85_9NOCA|nr:gamma-glutamyl-gamma-aminobutyrate hydrolase family protein [Rhodococcus trifolii]GGF94719.1 glutamine amidotransferase [Rhodococcus trifolii]